MKNTPHRTTSTGYQNGLSIVMEPSISDYQSALFSTFGARVHIHDAYDFLDPNAETKTVVFRTEAMIDIRPERTYSSVEVRELPISRRKCYLEYERPLKFMRKYSHLNCMAECRSEAIHRLCNCVPYYMPNYKVYTVCEMKDLRCVQRNWKSFHSVNVSASCDCLPDCNFNVYSADITTGYLDRRFTTSHYEFL